MRLDVIEHIVQTLGAVATAGAAWFAAIIAFRGLTKWRSETIGKRKAELAEEVLADFYQARDIIVASRSPGSFGHEGNTRVRAAWETDDDARALNSYFAINERLSSKQDFFAQLHARRYRFIAHFGLAAAKPYDDLFHIRSEIISAVQMLIMTHRQREQGSLPNDRRDWQDIIWARRGATDPIPSRLDEIVKEMESTCRPAIQEIAH
jgi:hypothetical protein